MDKLSLVQKQIRKTLEEFSSLKNVQSHILQIEEDLEKLYADRKTMEKQLENELKDIEKLESMSLKSLFYKTLGNKEQQMDKERQDYLQASLKLKEQKKEIELLEYERNLLRKKTVNLGKLEKKLEQLKEKRKVEILHSPHINLRNEFQNIVRKLDIAIRLNKELEEAIIEGEKAVKLLSTVSTYLKKAGQWGQWEKSRRGAYVKHQTIDRAIKELPKAQHQLNIFTRELRDLGESKINFKLNTVQFNRFTDFFFDNLISDWIIQQRIKSTLNNIDSTKAHAQRILLNIKQEKQQNIKKYEQLIKEKDTFLLS